MGQKSGCSGTGLSSGGSGEACANSFMLLSEFGVFVLVELWSPFPSLCQRGPVFDPKSLPPVSSHISHVAPPAMAG